jgi:hypothetical protein
VLAGLIAVLALRRREQQPLSLALAGSGVIGGVVGAASLTHSDGPIYLYFALWLAYVPLVIMLAVGVAVVGRAPTPSPEKTPAIGGAARHMTWPRLRSVVSLGVVAAVAVSALAVGSEITRGPINTTTGSGPWPPNDAGTAQGKERTIQVTLLLTRAAEGVIRPGDGWVNVTIGSTSLWPYVAGMVLGLDERGVQSTVSPANWTVYFGHERAPDRPVNVIFTLYPSSLNSARAPSGATVLLAIDGTVLSYQRVGD